MLTITRNDAVDLFNALNYPTPEKWGRPRMTRRLVELIKIDEGLEDEGGLKLEEKDGMDSNELARLGDLLADVLVSGGEIKVVRADKEVAAEEEKQEPEAEPEPEVVDPPVDEDPPVVDEEPTEPEPKPETPPKKKRKKRAKAKPPVEKREPPEPETEAEIKLAEAMAEVKRMRDLVKEEKKRERLAAKAKRKPKNAGPEIEGKLVDIKSLRNRLFACGCALKQRGLGEGLSEEMVALVDELVGGEPKSKASKNQLAWAWHAVNGYVNGDASPSEEEED
jgi:hypothetical protein